VRKMPYNKISDLPESIRNSLPESAQKIFMNAVNRALDKGWNDEKAFKYAWGAVKRRFKKEGDKWVKMSDEEAIKNLDMSKEHKNKIIEMLAQFETLSIKDVKEKLAGRIDTADTSDIDPREFVPPGSGAGTGGICKCPKCGKEVQHTRNQPCTSMKCPECGTTMQRKAEQSNEDYTDLQHTYSSIKDQMLLVENHIQMYRDDKDNEVCHSCIKKKHLPTIRALSREGTSFVKDSDEKERFRTYVDTMTDLIDNYEEDVVYLNSLQDKIRDMRKDLDMNLIPDGIGVLSDKAMELGLVPEKGVSGFDEKTENKIPEEYKFWIVEDVSERKSVRNKLAEAIKKDLIDVDLGNHTIPVDMPEDIDKHIREVEDSPKNTTVWTYNQESDRIEFEGTLLSYGAWNGYYYPPNVVDNFDANDIVGLPVRYGHSEPDIGEVTHAINKDHNIVIRGWIDDPKICNGIRDKQCLGLSPKLLFRANDDRKTVTHILKMIEASVVENPACKVCFIDNTH